MIQVKEVVEKEFIDESNTEMREVVKHPIWGILLSNTDRTVYYADMFTTEEEANIVAKDVEVNLREFHPNIKVDVEMYFLHE